MHALSQISGLDS